MIKKLSIFLVAGLIFAGCIHQNQTTTPAVDTEGGSKEQTNSSSMEEGVVEITVEGSEFLFEPSQIRVPEGSIVRLTFRNTGQASHDWRLDEFSAETNILFAGQEQTIEFVADQVGEFEYYCSVGTHRQMGMVGTLIVE